MIKETPIPIILFGFISNRYRYICLAPYQTDTDNRFKPILTDYLQVLFYISANITDTDTYINHTDTDYPVWIHIKSIPIPITIIGIGYVDLAEWLDVYQTDKYGTVGQIPIPI